MASNEDFVRYVADQLGRAGQITFKKMFGEYGIWCDGLFVAAVCDNQLFVKITGAGEALCPDCPRLPPYQGAKPYFLIENIENADKAAELVRVTTVELGMTSKKKKR